MILSAVLYRHMQIVQLACERVVSVSEFEDMRKTLEALLDAFDQRLDALIKTWRQQRIDVETQVECFTSGIFEGWYELVCIDTINVIGLKSDCETLTEVDHDSFTLAA